MASKEASLVRLYYNELVQAIVNPIPVADALYSKGVIDKSTQLDAALSSKNAFDRASKLLSAVERVVGVDPEKFPVFLSVLKEQLTTESLIEEIQQELQRKDTREESDTQIKQRKKVPTAHVEVEETDNETEAFSYWPAFKGVGAVLFLSLLLWILCMFFYKIPVSDEKITPFGILRSSPGEEISCHQLSNPSAAFDELYNDISDALMLGVHLGVPKVKLDVIERENRSEREKLIDILHACHDLDTCPCWEDIVNALVKYGNVRKSTEIKYKHIDRKNVHK